jgi:glycosyltransferase involved in cell wall biosynthesis
VLGKADTIVTVTDPLGKMLQTLTPRGSSKIEVIPTAMDAPMKHDEIQWESKKETISVGYVGSFYFNDRSYEMGAKPWYKRPPHYWLSHYLVEQDWKYRTPFYFFKAWQALQKVSADSYNRMRFELVGDVPSWLPSMAKEMGVFDKCTFHGRMLKEEVNRLTEGFDFLLATSMKYVGGEDYCLASKTFDYVTSGKPVLGFVCDGAQRDFLRNSNVGVLFEPDDPDTNAKTMHECFQKDIILSPRMSFLSNFSANATTSQLASIIHRLVAERQS